MSTGQECTSERDKLPRDFSDSRSKLESLNQSQCPRIFADAGGLAEARGECLAVFAQLSLDVLGIVVRYALQAGDMADGPVRGPT